MTEFPKLARIKQDDENMEKIHCAARRGQTELIRRLIAMGIEPSIPNKFGCTALHLACKHGQLSAVKELAPVSDISQSWHGQKPLHLAVQTGKEDIVQAMLDACKEAGRPIESFLNECDENEVDDVGPQGKKVLGQTAAHWCIVSNNMSMLKLLLSYGASPTAKDKSGETVLVRAIEFNNDEAFSMLMEAGGPNIRLDICDKLGNSAMHVAIRLNRPEMASKLMDGGHELGMENENKETPLIVCINAGFLTLLERMLEVIDPFVIQNCPFHNGQFVLPERIDWYPFCEEATKENVVKSLQRKLDQITNRNAVQSPPQGNAKGAKAPTQLTLAPSAPIRK